MVPVARFLLRIGISYNEFSEVSKMAFIKVGAEDYGIRGRPTNTSRISAMTGISRREVTRLRESLNEYDVDPRADLSPIGDVLHHWYTNSTYVTDEGFPKPLPYSGSGPSFESLISHSGVDVPAGAMRVELIRCGAVSESEDCLLLPTRRQAVPDPLDLKLLTSISFNLRALASTIAHNSNPTRSPDAGWIERFVQSPPVSDGERIVFRQVLRKRIEEFSEAIDDGFSSIGTGAENDSGRIGVGVYYYEDD